MMTNKDKKAKKRVDDENISLVCAFSMIEYYCIEHIIDEPKVNDIYKITDRVLLYGDNVTFEIEEYYGEEGRIY